MKDHFMKTHFRQNYTTDREDVVSYLEAIKQDFNRGEIVLKESDREVTILTQPYMDMSVEAYDQKGVVHFSIHFSWTSNPDSYFISKSDVPPESE